MNCKDYQHDLRIRAENNATALQTTQMLEVSEQKVQHDFSNLLQLFIH